MNAINATKRLATAAQKTFAPLKATGDQLSPKTKADVDTLIEILQKSEIIIKDPHLPLKIAVQGLSPKTKAKMAELLKTGETTNEPGIKKLIATTLSADKFKVGEKLVPAELVIAQLPKKTQKALAKLKSQAAQTVAERANGAKACHQG